MRAGSRWGIGSAALVALASFASFGGCGGRTPIDPEDYVLDEGAGGFDLGTGGSSGNQSGSVGGTSAKGGSGGAGGSGAAKGGSSGSVSAAGKGGTGTVTTGGSGGTVSAGGSSAGGSSPTGGGGVGGTTPASCGGCLSGPATSACASAYAACKGSTACATLNACLIAHDCANGDTKTLKQCAVENCASFVNGGLEKWLAFAECAECEAGAPCGGVCSGLGLCAGGGGSAGAGGAPFSQCDSCVSDVLSGKGCKSATEACKGVDGCFDFASCLVKTGCIDAGDPIACAQQNGCPKVSKKAGKALEKLLECSYCKACDGLCPNVPPGACSGGVGGGTGGGVAGGTGTGGTGTGGTGGTGTGGTGGDLQACVDCQNTAFNTCKDPYFACTADPPCNDILNCLQGCGEDPMCGSNCWSDNPKGQPKYYDLYYCYNCVACPSQCGPLVGGTCSSPLWPRAPRFSQPFGRRHGVRRAFRQHGSRPGLGCAKGSGPERPVTGGKQAR